MWPGLQRGTRPWLRRASQRLAAALGLRHPLKCRQRLSWGMAENISKEGKRLRSEAVDCAEVFPSHWVTVAVPSVPCLSYQVGSFSLLTAACPASAASDLFRGFSSGTASYVYAEPLQAVGAGRAAPAPGPCPLGSSGARGACARAGSSTTTSLSWNRYLTGSRMK